jgi:hypothetical protein
MGCTHTAAVEQQARCFWAASPHGVERGIVLCRPEEIRGVMSAPATLSLHAGPAQPNDMGA